MTGWNLPPGVNDRDSPGNRHIDILFEEESNTFCENCENGNKCDHNLNMCDRAHEFEQYFEKMYYNL